MANRQPMTDRTKTDIRDATIIVLTVALADSLFHIRQLKKRVNATLEQERLKGEFLNWIGREGWSLDPAEFHKRWNERAKFINFTIDHSREMHK